MNSEPSGIVLANDDIGREDPEGGSTVPKKRTDDPTGNPDGVPPPGR